jgi:hypothetical protein
MLTGSAELQADTPSEPVSARAKAIVPAAAVVELTDQIEQSRGGGVEMRSKLRDLITEALELKVLRVSRDDARTIDVHRRISLRRLYTAIFEGPGSRPEAR